MSNGVTRRDVIRLAGVAAIPVAAPALVLAQNASAPPAGAASADAFPRQDPAEVLEMVTVAHFDADRVKALVSRRPALANATVDWGFGDWETALGAASHTGRRPIAELLLTHGARPDIFTAAMMGWTDVVKGMIAANPDLARTRGPHGISLLKHAQAGGEAAAGVLSYLESLGDLGPDPVVARIEDAARADTLGDFAFGPADSQRFAIQANNQGMVELKAAGGSARRLFVVSADEFHPAGAPHVRVRFERQGAKVVKVTVTDADRVVVGERIGA